MLRPLYRCVLRLHPSGFRKRFADEMLSIFDHTAGTAAALGLLTDGLVSLLRQWTLRSEFWHDRATAQQPALDGIPSFCTLAPFRPSASAMIHGLVLSIAVFCLTCFAIRYSWIHVLHVHIPEAVYESPRTIPTSPSTGTKANLGLKTAAHFPANVPAPPSPSPVAAQNRVAQPNGLQSSTGDSQRPRQNSDAPPKVEVGGQPKRKQGTKSAQARSLEPNVVTAPDQSGIAQVQAQQSTMQQSMVHGAAGAPATSVGDGLALNAAERHRVIQGAIAYLTKYYVDSNLAEKMSAALIAYENSGDDDAATDRAVFAQLLTRQMNDVSHDPHVVMLYSRATAPEEPLAPAPEEVALYRKEMEQNRCTIRAAKILPHNIGYLKFDAFPDAAICGKTMAAAMASLNDADAIIFDLRDNRGGYANMVAFIATYLFDRRTHLNDFYDRGDNSTEQSWTLPPVPGNRLTDKPVFVLTSPSTFSAAEGFAYDLKVLKRATIVGETTSGRGHMGMPHRIDDHFTIRIPGIRVINPTSKTNWEGTGVEPDVKVKAEDSLPAAEKLAKERLR